MTYIFRPGGYNVTAAETATITPTFGGAAPFVPGPWYQGPWAADPAVPAIASANILVAYQPKWAGGIYTRTDAATYANSKINLPHPGTLDAYEGVAPTWSAAGWVFNAATEYLLTAITPTDNDYGYAVCVDQVGEATAFYFFGSQNTTTSNGVYVQLRTATNFIRFINGSTTYLAVATAQNNGSYGIRGNKGYILAVEQAGNIPAPTGAFNGPMGVGKLYFPAFLAPQGNSSTHRSMAFVAFKPAPTAAQMVQVLTAMEIIRAA